VCPADVGTNGCGVFGYVSSMGSTSATAFDIREQSGANNNLDRQLLRRG